MNPYMKPQRRKTSFPRFLKVVKEGEVSGVVAVESDFSLWVTTVERRIEALEKTKKVEL
jgi:hypothetical protein